MAYTIILCKKCGRPLGAKTAEKTRTCIFCGARNKTSEVEAIQRLDTARQLVKAISKLKMNMRQRP